ncbi:class I SAM-dependent methyltransferase [Chloroflexus sp.]|uniref:class I SAM-dependent methyltransferase n=1 Tax=Chloroflexus sp. TaxID=1904827 RepID=UPI002ACD9050|nr:class I SAM-dependent methyltransferase [Chloroflexus sp.]
MTFAYNQQQWNALGQLDPFWAMTGLSNWNLHEFFQTGRHQVAQLHEEMQRLGYPRRFQRVLDFGCGIGRVAPALREHFTEYIGLDVAESLILKARELHRDLPNAQFLVNTASRLDLPDNSIDLIFSFGVFQHIPDQQAILRLFGEFARVLAPGGLIFTDICHHIRWLYRLQLRRRAYMALKRLGLPDHALYYRLKLYPQSVHSIPLHLLYAHLKTLPLTIRMMRPKSPANAPHQLWEYALTKEEIS